MKKFGLAALLAVCVGSAAWGQEKVDLKTVQDRASYAIGVSIGRDFKQNGLTLNLDLVTKGVRDGLGGTAALKDDEIMAAIAALQRELFAKQKQVGVTWLADNAKRKGVTKLESGLQYEVVKTGKGATPKATEKVQVHYHGSLVDGKVFDSSVERGKPEVLEVRRLIPGWQEALQKMRVGDKWKLFIPSELAYGENGVDGLIPPNSVLVFDLELLGIEPASETLTPPK